MVKRTKIATNVGLKPSRAGTVSSSKTRDHRQEKGPPKRGFGGPPVRNHEAVWLEGRVPTGYWDVLENRRLYVCWLGQRLGFRKPEDWYRIRTDDFKHNFGGGLLEQHWNSSAIGAVKECFPAYDWKDWLFQTTPRRDWHDPENHRQYMKWLGEQLGIKDPSGWYRVTNEDFKRHKGGAFLINYDSTVSDAVMSYLPEYDWKEWMFHKTPKGFWHVRKNRKRYMVWLGQHLGFKRLDDWYAVIGDDFNANYGNQCLKLYGGSPLAALRDCWPRHTWHEWRFARVPFDFWDDLENRKRYVRWVGEKLKLKKPEDWYRVKRRQLTTNCGGGLLVTYHSYIDLLRECFPELDWDAPSAKS
jgi:hypothetical protein